MVWFDKMFIKLPIDFLSGQHLTFHLLIQKYKFLSTPKFSVNFGAIKNRRGPSVFYEEKISQHKMINE